MTGRKLYFMRSIAYSVILLFIYFISYTSAQQPENNIQSNIKQNDTPALPNMNNSSNISSLSSDPKTNSTENSRLSKENIDQFTRDIQKLQFLLLINENITENSIDKKVEITKTKLKSKQPEKSEIQTENSIFSGFFNFLNPSNIVTEFPSYTGDTVRRLPALNEFFSSVSNLHTIFTDKIPGTAREVARAAQNRAFNLTRIHEYILSSMNATNDLSITVEEAQSTVTLFNNKLLKLLKQIPELAPAVFGQTSITLTRFPDTIKGLPKNLVSLTDVVYNLENTIRKIPNELQKIIGVLPLVGDNDSSETLQKTRLREKFESKESNKGGEAFLIGNILLNSNGSLNSFERTLNNALIFLRKAVDSLQGSQSKICDFGPDLRPLVRSSKSLLDLIEYMKIANKFIPGATLGPLLGLVNELPDTASKIQFYLN